MRQMSIQYRAAVLLAVPGLVVFAAAALPDDAAGQDAPTPLDAPATRSVTASPVGPLADRITQLTLPHPYPTFEPAPTESTPDLPDPRLPVEPPTTSTRPPLTLPHPHPTFEPPTSFPDEDPRLPVDRRG